MTERFDNLKLPAGDAGDTVPPEIAAELERVSVSRRNFLQATGLAALGAVVAGCRAEPRSIVTPNRRAPDTTPGVAYWYASTCEACSAGCGVLFKSRDGRPIKMEGNPSHPMSRGGLCAKGQAAVLGLYDPDRLKTPLIGNAPATWGDLDAKVAEAIRSAPAGSVRVLGATRNGPTTRDVLREFVERVPGARHLSYDAVPASALLEAHRLTHGAAVLPRFRFDRARVIASFGADFLGTWISPVEFARQWAEGRKPGSGMSRHVQVEAAFTLSGAAADTRVRLPESEQGAVLVRLAKEVAKRAGVADPFGDVPAGSMPAAEIARLAEDLWKAREGALVVCGSDDVNRQLVTVFINQALKSYGSTIDLASGSQQKLGDDGAVNALIDEMERGRVSVLVLWGANPAYDLPQSARFAAALKKVATTVSICDRQDETAVLCGLVAPENHALESWGDHEPQVGLFSLTQPGLRPLYRTRQGIESLLAWCGSPRAGKTALEVVKAYWEANVLKGTTWASVLDRGFLDRRTEGGGEFKPAVTAEHGARAAAKAAGSGLELVAYEGVTQGDGRHANNAWLQELPDPLSMVCWENFVAMAPATMATLGVAHGDIVSVDGSKGSLKLPAVKQPGMAENTAAIAVGYGRTHCGRLATGNSAAGVIGANVYPLIERGKVGSVKVSPTGATTTLAMTQTHDSQEGRGHAKEVLLSEYLKNPRQVSEEAHPAGSMWPGYEYKGHRWGLVVDLHGCIGCTACVVGCQAENNIPVVGKEEVRLRREMSWMRIDRYYSDDKPQDQGAVADNPAVSFQPLMCQHCENAPCETVCPVLATTHSGEGLNQQTYNRCVGTRYCANNCPVKVRRFNWFDYKHDDPTLNLVLNPDVTVRTRGVMEKCSMCVQRIHDGKLAAKKEGRAWSDHDARTACEQSCPTQAIVFGDLNDPTSDAAKLVAGGRNYVLLGELNVKPGVHYLAKVRNSGEPR